MKTATTMKLKRGARVQLTNSRACIFVLEGEQKSYIDALAEGRNPKVSQSTIVREMITHYAETHKI